MSRFTEMMDMGDSEANYPSIPSLNTDWPNVGSVFSKQGLSPLWRKITKPLTRPLVLSCAEPVSRSEAPLLTMIRVAPAPKVWVTEGACVSAMLPCGNVMGSGSGAPV